jgi:hypothetical protein
MKASIIIFWRYFLSTTTSAFNLHNHMLSYGCNMSRI